MVSWNWKAGTTSGITTNGSTTITPTAYSFNTTAGFSIVKYKEMVVVVFCNNWSHGLGVAPKMIIIKIFRTSGGEHWIVYNA